MEVHHHGHVHHESVWKQYLSQFFMLFLAVFFGGLAEYQRDHIIEKEQEKEYILSMMEDIDEDIRNIEVDLQNKTDRIKNSDSLNGLMIDGGFENQTAVVYYAARKFAIQGYDFHMTDGTLMELKSSGKLRLIEKYDIVDSLQSYYNLYQQFEDAQTFEIEALNNYHDAMTKVFDVKVFDTMIDDYPNITKPAGNPPLFNNNPALINEFLMRVQLSKNMAFLNIKFLNKLKASALNLKTQVEKEYELDK
jgi:hypothetical protein